MKYRIRRWGAGLSVVILGILGLGLLNGNNGAVVQGDQLGPDNGELRQEYVQRAAVSVAQADEPAYALVTFTYPLNPAQAAAVLGEVKRVDAIVIGTAAPIDVPEPVPGASREDVFRTALERLNAGLNLEGSVGVPQTISAVVVHDAGESLRSLAANDQVAVVEVAPATASWARLAIRPVAAAE